MSSIPNAVMPHAMAEDVSAPQNARRGDKAAGGSLRGALLLLFAPPLVALGLGAMALGKLRHVVRR
jgi:hypothetical protein